MYRALPFILPLFLMQQPTFSSELDVKLDLVERVYRLQPKDCSSHFGDSPSGEEVQVGKLLFESKSLSGKRDISCSDCHLDQFGSADGLPISVGVGGDGEGYERLESDSGALVQRNAISLFGRSNPEFTSYFWDGKVQVSNGRIITQFGDQLAPTIESPLAAAAMLPLVERDEFIGIASFLRPNDIEEAIEDSLYFRRYEAVSKAIRNRLLNPETEEDKELAVALSNLGVNVSDFNLAVVGNLIAKFISDKFECESSDWDKYLRGNSSALMEEQKRGAILFYGKGRCASCHSGSFFSDFSFHSIGTPQGFFGPYSRHRDIGRAAVTHRLEDLYLFRTPPLIDVKSTPPYGHNGAFATLREVVVHHFNPLNHYINNPDYEDADFFRVGKLIESRAAILATIDLDSEDELATLLAFLNAL